MKKDRKLSSPRVSICLPVCLSACLSACLAIYPSTSCISVYSIRASSSLHFTEKIVCSMTVDTKPFIVPAIGHCHTLPISDRFRAFLLQATVRYLSSIRVVPQVTQDGGRLRSAYSQPSSATTCKKICRNIVSLFWNYSLFDGDLTVTIIS